MNAVNRIVANMIVAGICGFVFGSILLGAAMFLAVWGEGTYLPGRIYASPLGNLHPAFMVLCPCLWTGVFALSAGKRRLSNVFFSIVLALHYSGVAFNMYCGKFPGERSVDTVLSWGTGLKWAFYTSAVIYILGQLFLMTRVIKAVCVRDSSTDS